MTPRSDDQSLFGITSNLYYDFHMKKTIINFLSLFLFCSTQCLFNYGSTNMVCEALISFFCKARVIEIGSTVSHPLSGVKSRSANLVRFLMAGISLRTAVVVVILMTSIFDVKVSKTMNRNCTAYLRKRATTIINLSTVHISIYIHVQTLVKQS